MQLLHRMFGKVVSDLVDIHGKHFDSTCAGLDLKTKKESGIRDEAIDGRAVDRLPSLPLIVDLRIPRIHDSR